MDYFDFLENNEQQKIKIDKGEQERLMTLAEIQRLNYFVKQRDLEIESSRKSKEDILMKYKNLENKVLREKNKKLNFAEKLKIEVEENKQLREIILQQNQKIEFLLNELDNGQKRMIHSLEPSDELSEKRSIEFNDSDDTLEDLINSNLENFNPQPSSPFRSNDDKITSIERLNLLESENIQLKEKIQVLTFSFRELYQQTKVKDQQISQLEKKRITNNSDNYFSTIDSTDDSLSLIEKIEEKYSSTLAEYKNEISNLEKEIKNLKNENYILTHRISNNDNENIVSLLKELEDLKRKYFFTLCCGIKLNYLLLGNTSALSKIDSRKLYKKAKFHHHSEWDSFIDLEINKK